MKPEDQLEIERLGGLAGIGLPGSRIRSRALISCSDLNTDELAAVSALFEAQGNKFRSPDHGADFFFYRITLHSSDGNHQIEVGERNLVESLQQRVQDELL